MLDDMVGDKRPQRALGIYIGTVVYCIPLLIMVSDRYPAPVLAVLIAIILAVINMFVFIFFIDFVSKSIKPAQVCNRIYQQAQIHLQRLSQPVEEASLSCQNPNRPKAAPYVVEAKISGYFQELRLDALIKICKEKKLIAEVVPVRLTI
ncbi:MAG: DUF2254 family protein [Owenweeksia sp.]|nr:DUF2254 family protein [Owenweeksia sp.]